MGEESGQSRQHHWNHEAVQSDPQESPDLRRPQHVLRVVDIGQDAEAAQAVGMPLGGGTTRRIVRPSSRTPSRASSCSMASVAVDRGILDSPAAALKLLRSMTRTSRRMLSSRSIGIASARDASAAPTALPARAPRSARADPPGPASVSRCRSGGSLAAAGRGSPATSRLRTRCGTVPGAAAPARLGRRTRRAPPAAKRT